MIRTSIPAPKKMASRFVVPIRYRQIGDKVLITNDLGDWHFLDQDDFATYTSGKLKPTTPLYAELGKKSFIAPEIAQDKQIQRMARRLSHLKHGPNLHIVVVTLRCDHTCRYCQASRVGMKTTGYDMSVATAERVVDTVFMSPNPNVTIEFQGGEPLANFDVIKHIVEYATEKNQYAKKKLAFTLVSNMTFMDEEKLDYILKHRMEVCTSLDGPEDLHDHNRRVKGGGSYKHTVKWIETLNKRYEAMGLDPQTYRVESILTTTRSSLHRYKEIVDTYVDVGCRALFLRPLSPYGFAKETAEKIAYSIEEWLEFYTNAVDYIIELNRQGIDVLERFAAIFLTKILTGDDPNYLDIRSPCGAGIGQIAYNYDGRVFTCDEGRMVHEMGDSIFQMGDLATDGYIDLINNETVRGLVVASIIDGVPGCAACAYKPYCGVCPVHNYTEQGSLSGRMGESSWCKKHMGIQDYLFGLLLKAQDDPELLEILTRWTVGRPRPHFVHE